jgi:hypothetical protein
MPPVVIGGALAAAGAVTSAAIGNKGASNAAKATTQAADTAAQVQRENYDRSAQALAPWQQSGLAANSAINALLGLPTQQPANVGQFAQPNAMSQYAGSQGFARLAQNRNAPYQPTPAAPPVNQQQAYQNAFDNYRNSTGYQFRLNQGLDAVNSGYAGAGTIKSGAAMKAVNDYGQGMASQEFANYLASLGNQQGLGFNAASAQAGVGQNTANSLSNIAMNQGNNLANAALLKSQNTGNALNSIAGIAGGIFGKRS